MMASREERIAGWGADARGGVPVSEAHALVGELIEVRGGDFARRVVTSQISNAQVVGIEDQDVGLVLRDQGWREMKAEEGPCEECERQLHRYFTECKPLLFQIAFPLVSGTLLRARWSSFFTSPWFQLLLPRFVKLLFCLLLLLSQLSVVRALTPDRISAQIESNTALVDDAEAQASLPIWQDALLLSQQLADLRADTSELLLRVKTGSSVGELEIPPALGEGASLSEQSARLAELTAAIETTRSRLDQSSISLDNTATRIAELSGLIAQARDNLADLRLPAEGGGKVGAAEVQRALLSKEVQEARIANYQAEQAFQQAETEQLPERIRLRKEHLAQLTLEKDRVQLVIAALRKEEAKSISEALVASSEKYAHIPELAQVIEDIRQLNERRTGVDGLQAKIKAAGKYEKSIQRTKTRISTQESNARQKIKLLEMVGMGIDTDTGIVLREQRADLPSTALLSRTLRSNIEVLAQSQIALLDLQDVLAAHPMLKSSVVSRLVRENPKLTKQEISDLQSQRRSLLEALQADHRALNTSLSNTNENARITIDSINNYSMFLDRRLLWIKSTEPIAVAEFGEEWRRLVALFNPESLQLAWRSIRESWAERLIPNLFLATAFFFSLLRRRKLKRYLKDSSEQAARRNCTSIVPTLETLLSSFILAFMWPALCFLLAGLISEPVGYRVGLNNMGLFLLVGGLLSKFSKKGGLFDSHVKFLPEKSTRIRTTLRYILPVLAPLIFGVGALCLDGRYGSSGRVVFMVTMIAVTVLAHRLFHPSRTIVSRELKPQFLVRLCHLLAVGLPLSFAIGAGLGYFSSVLTVRAQVLASGGILLAAFIVIRFFTRWILVSRRRLAITQALARREANLAQQKREEEGDSEEVSEVPSLEEVKSHAVDVVEVEEQTTQLVRLSVYFSVFFAIWAIWSSSLTALSILDQIPLWKRGGEAEAVQKADSALTSFVPGTASASSETAGTPVDSLTEIVRPNSNRVTVQDLLLSFFFFFLTFIAARNIPGLLSLTVFNRLNLGPGGNFAFTTIVRYFIVLVGVVLGLGKIGITWDKVQWLAAAITLGIGFGLQEIFANFVAGLILLFERPIRLGDIVTVGDVSGKVTEIKIRATTIQQFNNRALVVPNKDFITSQLINWTLRDTILRFELPVGVAYGSDTRRVTEILTRLVNEHPDILEDPAPVVIFQSFGASTLDFLIRAHVGRVEVFVDTQSELHFQIDDAFREAGIEIAFPQQDIHLRSVPEGFSLPVSTPK